MCLLYRRSEGLQEYCNAVRNDPRRCSILYELLSIRNVLILSLKAAVVKQTLIVPLLGLTVLLLTVFASNAWTILTVLVQHPFATLIIMNVKQVIIHLIFFSLHICSSSQLAASVLPVKSVMRIMLVLNVLMTPTVKILTTRTVMQMTIHVWSAWMIVIVLSLMRPVN